MGKSWENDILVRGTPILDSAPLVAHGFGYKLHVTGFQNGTILLLTIS